MIRNARCTTLWGERRGAVAVMAAVMLPALLGAAGLAIDVGVWYREAVRLQIAADAGAEGAGRLLAAKTATTAQFQAAALIEVNGVTNSQTIGTLQTPVTVSVASNWSQVTVTLTSTPNDYFMQAIGFTPSAITASATVGLQAPAACILALSGSGNAIQVDNMGSIVANGCPIFSDANIYLNSGTIRGSSISAADSVTTSNSGSNTLSPSPGTSNAGSESNPYSALTVPSYGACSYTNASFTAWQAGPYQFTQSANVFCGNTTIGGNGTTDTFAAGTYYVVNGTLTFNNADVTSASGVTFVLTGSSPGAFNWTNYSNTTVMTAPTTGSLAGILIWQTCNASNSTNPANTFNGGGTLEASGEIYMPCGALDLNNDAQLTATSSGSFGVVASTIYATGSAGLSTTASGGSSSSGGQLVLVK